MKIKFEGVGIPNYPDEIKKQLQHNAFYNEEDADEIKRVFKALAKM